MVLFCFSLCTRRYTEFSLKLQKNSRINNENLNNTLDMQHGLILISGGGVQC